MIEVDNIHKSYGAHHVLRGLSFSVPKGGITGLVGPNGSGKTTTIRVLTGYTNADSGSVKVDDQAMNIHATAAKQLIGYVPENASAYREHTVREYLNFIGEIKGIEKRKRAEQIEYASDCFSLATVMNQLIGTLSKGYRHRVVLAQSLLGDPEVLVLDEPTDGLDPIQKIETRRIIRQLAEKKAVLLTTHLLEEVELLCDRIVFLKDGQVEKAGTINDVLESTVAESCIHLRIADSSIKLLRKSIADVDGLIEISSQEVDAHIYAQLRFKSSANTRDLLNEVSLAINRQSIRIIELRKETASLSAFYQ